MITQTTVNESKITATVKNDTVISVILPTLQTFEVTPYRSVIQTHDYFAHSPIIRGETPLGEINGQNRSFKTANFLTSPIIWVYLNGMILTEADYQVAAPNEIVLDEAPYVGDLIIVDYLL